MKLFTVWVGGVEVSDDILTTLEEAEKIADNFKKEGYDDVVIEEIVK